MNGLLPTGRLERIRKRAANWGRTRRNPKRSPNLRTPRRRRVEGSRAWKAPRAQSGPAQKTW